ncbi:MAG: response regulator transcription factor [Bulleidia sp.]
MGLIYCVEDDTSIREIEIYTLNSTGYEAIGFENGKDFFEALRKRMPDLVLLDIMLPDISGMDILQKMKKDPKLMDIPVILASAKGTEFDKISGLDTGADDYLAKPFGMMEMVSRVRAVLRRSQKKAPSVITTDRISLNDDTHEVRVEGEPVELTLKEYSVLKLLMSHPNIVFTRDRLLNEIWGLDYDGETRTVDVHIRTLRTKLKEAGSCIETIRGVGYRYKDNHEKETV